MNNGWQHRGVVVVVIPARADHTPRSLKQTEERADDHQVKLATPSIVPTYWQNVEDVLILSNALSLVQRSVWPEWAIFYRLGYFLSHKFSAQTR